MKPLIFLDIDGVLNGHEWLLKGVSISPPAVDAFNHVLSVLEPDVVISSAWRYMIHGGAMTLRGFGYMLRTHGIIGLVDNLVGLTPRDEEVAERGAQISAWRATNSRTDPYVVIDDEDFQITKYGHPLVQTDGKVGLTMSDAERVISVFAIKESP